MATEIIGYMNVYKSGFFHKAGKADTFDRHAGDIYASHDAAVRDIHPRSHYVATVSVLWTEPGSERPAVVPGAPCEPCRIAQRFGPSDIGEDVQ